MRLKHRRLLGFALLAAYASISILGDGLHELIPEAGHHHHGLDVVVHAHEQPSSKHDFNIRSTSAGAASIVHNCDVDSHLCGICAFLFQTISPPAQVDPPCDWQPLIVVAVSRPQPIYARSACSPQAARGPPLLLA